MFASTTQHASAPHRVSIDVGEKRIILIRHGCTHMNEYLSKPGSRWGEPTFTDDWSLRDSALSFRGIQQAKKLSQHFSSRPEDLLDVDLVVISPLTRALQTLEFGLLPHFENRRDILGVPPIVALPFAAERVYMSSEIGRPVEELKNEFPFVDFESGFDPSCHPPNEWWWKPSPGKEMPEWRPHGQGQQYINVGEPEDEFHLRMRKLYDWLACRKEETIVLICHWAVLQYLCGHDFQNCEVKEMPFEKLSRSGFALTAEEEEAIFAQGERDLQKNLLLQ